MLGWPWSRQLQLQTLCTVSSNASIPLGGEWGGGLRGIVRVVKGMVALGKRWRKGCAAHLELYKRLSGRKRQGDK